MSRRKSGDRAGAENSEAPSAEHPEQTTEEGDGHRLDEELDQDVRLAGADRLADADLARPFGHRYQHDVHDADAADQEGDADHAGDN